MKNEKESQSTIKMEKGYYNIVRKAKATDLKESQSTIKMEKGYYTDLADYYKNKPTSRNPQ